MASETNYVYFDACVFLDYLNNTPGRSDIIAELLAQAERIKHKVLTSVLSRVEVAYVQEESLGRALDPEVEARIDSLWSDSSVVEIVEMNGEIALLARRMVRDGLCRGWKLKVLDAIHLATAEWAGARQFLTYDSSLFRYSEVVGCPICEPHVAQSRLPNL